MKTERIATTRTREKAGRNGSERKRGEIITRRRNRKKRKIQKKGEDNENES